MSSNQNANGLSPALPEDFTQDDVEALLGRVYAWRARSKPVLPYPAGKTRKTI